MVWILLFSEVTPFEYNVSTILSPIVELSTTEKKLTKQAWEQPHGAPVPLSPTVIRTSKFDGDTRREKSASRSCEQHHQ